MPMIKRHLLAFIAALALVFPMPLLVSAQQGVAEAGTSAKSAKRSKKSSKSSRRARRGKAQAERSKVCKSRGGKRQCRWMNTFQGHAVGEERLRTEPLPTPSGEIWVYAENLREEVKVNIFDQAGKYNEDALAQLDNLFRCKRSGEVRAVDPRLYEILSMIYDQYGQRIDLVSGFRNQPDRDTSRHYHASAMDIRVPGISVRELYEFANDLDVGGMGIGKYPRAGFVHVDWRAPGEKSYRWTDYSPPTHAPKKARKKGQSRRNRPNS